MNVDEWKIIFDEVSENKACALNPSSNCIGIKNDNKIFTKQDFDQSWFNSIKSLINGECDVVIYNSD